MALGENFQKDKSFYALFLSINRLSVMCDRGFCFLAFSLMC
jgi:hypothetical protein